MTNNKCFFLVSIAGEKPRKIIFELATDVCPQTCHNFMSFCESKDTSKSYRNTQFHRVIPGFMIQGGDYQNGDGTGGESFQGGNLLDESFDLRHDAPGILSMANRGKNTAGSQFFITLEKAPHLDGKHVVFGHVVQGMDVVQDIAKVETDQNDRPVSLQKVLIVDCGIIDNATTDAVLSSDVSEKKRQKSSKKDSKRKKSKRRDRHYSSDEYSSESDDDDDSSERGRKRHRERRHKKSSHRRRHSSKKSRKSYSDSDDSFSSEESEDSRKRRKKRKEKHRHYSSEESEYSDKRRKERKHDHKTKKKKRKKEYSEDIKEAKPTSTVNTFGMYGVIRDTDFMTSSKVKRSFERWMEEVKGVPQGANIARWEVTNFMKEYAEDFNTATLPHVKYYDYDKWEMEDYNKRKEESKRKKGALSDEIEYQEEMKKRAEEKRRREFEMVKAMMSKDRIDEMKKQSQLRAELQNAYRVGDEKTRKRLQKKLEPEQR